MDTTNSAPRPRRRLTIGTACLLLAPLLTAAADMVRMTAEHSGALVGMVSANGPDAASTMLTTIEAHAGEYQLASWLAFAAAVLTIPAAATVRVLTAARSPRWSTAATITGICLAIGQFVHLMGYFAWNQILATLPDRSAAVAVLDLTNRNVFGQVVFAPYLVGVLLFWPFAAVALWRARVIPLWAFVVILAAAVVMTVAGSSYLTSPAWAVATVVGLFPAFARTRSERTDADSSAIANGLASGATTV